MARVKLLATTLTVPVGEEPFSRSAGWSRHLGAFAFLFTMVALLFHIEGLAETPELLAAFALALAAATIAIFLSVRAFTIIWRRGKRGTPDAILGLIYAITIWTIPLLLLAQASSLPQAGDVATQGDPPAFLDAGFRPEWANPVDLGKVTPVPGPRPLLTDVNLTEIYALAQIIAFDLGWDIVAERAPEKKSLSAAFQATDTSLLGFTDDVVVRIVKDGKRTRVDVRSASRYGSIDLGVNEERINAFLLALRQRLNER